MRGTGSALCGLAGFAGLGVAGAAAARGLLRPHSACRPTMALPGRGAGGGGGDKARGQGRQDRSTGRSCDEEQTTRPATRAAGPQATRSARDPAPAGPSRHCCAPEGAGQDRDAPAQHAALAVGAVQLLLARRQPGAGGRQLVLALGRPASGWEGAGRGGGCIRRQGDDDHAHARVLLLRLQQLSQRHACMPFSPGCRLHG